MTKISEFKPFHKPIFQRPIPNKFRETLDKFNRMPYNKSRGKRADSQPSFAFTAGQKAFKLLIPFSNNPYHVLPEKTYWYNGYKSAERTYNDQQRLERLHETQQAIPRSLKQEVSFESIFMKLTTE
jgi:hypothetical protein